jgi:hypothetical protein
MRLAEMMDEDRRLLILRALAQADAYTLGERLLHRVLNEVGVGVVAPDQVRGYLTWLHGQALVAIERLPQASGEMWLATATGTGLAVARGRAWPGIAAPPERL